MRAVDELGRKAEHASTERVDQEELNEIVEREAEEAVDVAANDPAHAARLYLAIGPSAVAFERVPRATWTHTLAGRACSW